MIRACQMSLKKLKILQENTKKKKKAGGSLLLLGIRKNNLLLPANTLKQVEHNGNYFIFVNIEKNWVIPRIADVWEHWNLLGCYSMVWTLRSCLQMITQEKELTQWMFYWEAVEAISAEVNQCWSFLCFPKHVATEKVHMQWFLSSAAQKMDFCRFWVMYSLVLSTVTDITPLNQNIV